MQGFPSPYAKWIRFCVLSSVERRKLGSVVRVPVCNPGELSPTACSCIDVLCELRQLIVPSLPMKIDHSTVLKPAVVPINKKQGCKVLRLFEEQESRHSNTVTSVLQLSHRSINCGIYLEYSNTLSLSNYRS